MTVKKPNSVIKMGAIRLDVPNGLSPEEALNTHATNYPHLTGANLTGPEVIGGEFVYSVEKPPVGTKG